MRLNKFLSHAGVASRRKCDEYIKSGKVQINGRTLTDFSYQVKSGDIVLCDRQLIENSNKRVVYLLNKPKGYICTNSDTIIFYDKFISHIDNHSFIFAFWKTQILYYCDPIPLCIRNLQVRKY